MAARKFALPLARTRCFKSKHHKGGHMHTIDANGANMPALGFGTWDLEGDVARKNVASAIGMGYRHIDTAFVYNNETEVGQGIRDSKVPRDSIFLTTKIWSDYLAEGDLQSHAEQSLKRLGTDYVDLLLIHWPNPSIPLEQSIRALQDVQAKGLARHIGVSNFTVALMREAVEKLGAKLACNQVEYHPYLNQKPVLDFIRKNNMALTAYSPMSRGRSADDTLINDIAARYKKSARQVVLRWLVQQPGVAAIPKSRNPDHQRDNFNVFDFALTDTEMQAMANLARPDGRTLSPGFAPQWDQAA